MMLASTPMQPMEMTNSRDPPASPRYGCGELYKTVWHENRPSILRLFLMVWLCAFALCDVVFIAAAHQDDPSEILPQILTAAAVVATLVALAAASVRLFKLAARRRSELETMTTIIEHPDPHEIGTDQELAL